MGTPLVMHVARSTSSQHSYFVRVGPGTRYLTRPVARAYPHREGSEIKSFHSSQKVVRPTLHRWKN